MKVFKKTGIVVSLISLTYLLTMLIVLYVNYQTNTEVTVQLAGHQEVTSSLLDMTVSAEVIVKGRYTAVPDTVNGIVTTRTVNNSDKTQKSLLNTYRFEIEEIIKGKTSDKTIYINHHYSDTVYVYEEDGSGRVVGTVEVINPLFVEPKEDQSVIVFLSSTALEREYEGATEPFIVGVNDKDELTLYSNGLNEKNTSETFQTYRLKEGYRLSIEMPDFNFEDTVTGKCVSDIVTIIKANQLN